MTPHTPLGRAAVAAWAVVLAVTCLRPLAVPDRGTVYPIYARAGADFAAGRTLYVVPEAGDDHFRYSPLVAAGFVPFDALPLGVGGMLWRMLGAAVYLTGLAAWARAACPGVRPAALFLLAVPLSWASLYNGQANPHVLGLMLWAGVLAVRGRWGWAGVLVAGAVLVKGYPLALGLLLGLIAPVWFGLSLAAGVVAGVAVPFALHDPAYVADQYRHWWHILGIDDRSHFARHAGYQDVSLLLRVAGLDLSRPAYQVVELVAGAAAAGLALRQLRAGVPRREVVLNALTLGLCWMTLFGPSTESSTFILLAPVAAREVADRRGRLGGLAAAGWGLFVVAWLVFTLPHTVHRPVIAAGVQPLAALLVTTAAVRRVVVRP